MPPREISLCEDETFHPQICLVAIEPVSNFLLLEQYAPQRDTATWTQCLDERLAGWSVTVCQVTSDEAKALIAHAEQALGAHHSPDLFHVQQDLVHATSLALAGQTARAHRPAVATESRRITASLLLQLYSRRPHCQDSNLGTCVAPVSPEHGYRCHNAVRVDTNRCLGPLREIRELAPNLLRDRKAEGESPNNGVPRVILLNTVHG